MTNRTLTTTRCLHHAGATVLAVTGELDHHTAPELTRAIGETPFGPHAPVVFDLSGLTYCDSTGITVLISASNHAQRTDGRLVFVGLNADLMRVFRIVGLDQILTFRPTLDDAIDVLESPGGP
ncbi:STAS domain-containing protein [Streptomyces sp. NPDC053429]|uniref:STAS domain-containing protein n=1 Tax=unclassified Streptomyces TaxID=2593676 RepID=UPI00340A89D7